MHVRILVRAPHAAPLQFAAGTALATASPRTLAACRFAPDDAAGPGGACALVRGWLAGLAAICAAHALADMGTAPAAASRRSLEAYTNLLELHQQLACRFPRAALAAALACAARAARGAPPRTAMGVAAAAPTRRPLAARRLLGWHIWATRGVRERVVMALAVMRSLPDLSALYPGCKQ